MADLELVLKCDKNFDEHFNMTFDSPSNSTVELVSDVSAEVTEAAGIGTFTGIVIAILINTFLSIEYDKYGDTTLKIQFHQYFSPKSVSRTIAIMILALASPIAVIFACLAVMYKIACSVIIRRKDKRFVKFLDSFDVFWSLEDDVSKSIINVLGVIESDSSETLNASIKNKLMNIVQSEETDKIFYRRREQYGFYYWRKYSYIDMDQYVQIIDCPDKCGELTVSDLEGIMAAASNKALPYLDEGLFQILITKKRIGNDKRARGDYGIIFRIHHSVGDGVALIDFLCKTLADGNDDSPINMFCLPDSCSVNYSSPTSLISMIRKLCEIPVCFVDGILREPDNNSLHGPKLLGKKIFKWTESDENLLTKVKEIKENVEGLHFSDVLAAALTNGLNTFFSKTMANIPEDVAVVLPVRFPKAAKVNSELKLGNDFSVTILDLPTNGIHDLNQIQRRCDGLRRSADALSNYYFLKLVSGILPRQFLQPLLNSSQATMVFSNMPGPASLKLCGGNVLKNLVFFVPHKGTTGLGVTALCYGGVLRFAAMADEALVSNGDDLALILDGIMAEIQRMHHRFVAKAY